MRFLCLVFGALFHFRLESHQPKGVEKLKLPHTCAGRPPIRKFFSFVEESDKEKCTLWAAKDDENQKGATAPEWRRRRLRGWLWDFPECQMAICVALWCFK